MRSNNDGVSFDGSYELGWVPSTNGPAVWQFDARGFTGNSQALQEYTGGFDQWVQLGVVADFTDDAVYGIFNFGSGWQMTQPYTVSAAALATLSSVSITADYREPALYLGSYISNVNVSVNSVPPLTSGIDVMENGGAYWQYDGSTWTYLAGPHLSVTTVPNATAGQSVLVTVTATDALGETVSGYLATIHFASSDADAILPADYTFTPADDGAHTFDVTLVTSGSQSVTVTDTSNEAGTATAPVFPEDGDFQSLASGNLSGQDGWYGDDVPVQQGIVNEQVVPVDSNGNPIEAFQGSSENFTVPAGTAQIVLTFDTLAFSSTTTSHVRSNNDGVALGGGYELGWVPVTNTTGQPFWEFDVRVFTGNPQALQELTGGFDQWVQLGVVADFADDEVYGIFNFGSGWQMTQPYTVSAAALATLTAVSIVADYRDPSAYLGSYVSNVNVTLPAPMANGTANVTVNAAPAATFSVDPPPVPAGMPTTVTVTAYDAYGNVATGFNGTVNLSSSNGKLTQMGNPSSSEPGIFTYNVKFGAAGGDRLLASSGTGGSQISGGGSVLVTPAPVDLGQSTVSAASTVGAGQTIIVTLVARDADGNQESEGGATVAFLVSGGGGSFSQTVDHGDGTYTAVFTAGTTPGTDTITGEVNGANLTSSPASVQVTAGPPSPAQSSIGVFPASVAAGGTTTVTLSLADEYGNPEPAGLPVQFSLGSGTAGGGFGPVTYLGNGTYTAQFQGTTAGSNTISATVNGQSVTAKAASVSVTPAAASLAQSTAGVSGPTITAGGSVIVTLTAVDGYGNTETIPLTAGFALGTGSAGGTFGSIVPNPGDGTYSVTFSPTAAGSDTFVATINGQALTSQAPIIAVPVAPTGTIANVTPTFAWPTVAGAASYVLKVTDKTTGRKFSASRGSPWPSTP